MHRDHPWCILRAHAHARRSPAISTEVTQGHSSLTQGHSSLTQGGSTHSQGGSTHSQGGSSWTTLEDPLRPPWGGGGIYTLELPDVRFETYPLLDLKWGQFWTHMLDPKGCRIRG